MSVTIAATPCALRGSRRHLHLQSASGRRIYRHAAVVRSVEPSYCLLLALGQGVIGHVAQLGLETIADKRVLQECFQIITVAVSSFVAAIPFSGSGGTSGGCRVCGTAILVALEVEGAATRKLVD